VRAPWGKGLHWARALGTPKGGLLQVRWDADGSQGEVFVSDVEWHGRPQQLTMFDYISYPELQLSALLSMAVPTHFINDGKRDNLAELESGQCEKMGIYVAQVGCRFKKQAVQEYELLLATPWQNTFENGFGWGLSGQLLEHPDFHRRQLWARVLWQTDTLPSYEEACSDCSGRFYEVAPQVLLDKVGLFRRLKWVIEPFLIAANNLARERGQQAYVHCVGLGLGVWLGDCKTKEGELEVARQQLEVYINVIQSHDFPHLDVVDLSWFPEHLGQAAQETESPKLHWRSDSEALVSDTAARNIVLKFSRRNPATPVPNGCLLVAQYAWDGNAYPASCSTIGELQNPSINLQAFAASRIEVMPRATESNR